MLELQISSPAKVTLTGRSLPEGRRYSLLEPVSKGAKHAFACYEAKAPNIVKLEV